MENVNVFVSHAVFSVFTFPFPFVLTAHLPLDSQVQRAVLKAYSYFFLRVTSILSKA